MLKIKWLENTKISWGLISIIVIGVIFANALLARKTINTLATTQESLLKASDILNELNRLHVLILSAESGQRGYLLTENAEYLAPYADALSELNLQLKTVAAIRSELPGQKAKIDTLLTLTQDKLDELTTSVGLALSDQERQAIKLVMTGKGRELYRDIRQTFEEVEGTETRYRQLLFTKLAATEHEAQITFMISAITSSLLLIGMVFLARLNLRIEQQHKAELIEQNEVLQNKVEERTAELKLYSQELKLSNRELEDFAFVASHDLQEPLRKIRAFGDRLQTNYTSMLDDRGADYINRMRNAAERMSDLINDLLEFSRITTRGKDFVATDLNQTITTVLDDLEIAITESNARVERCDLPEVDADPSQMYQLFLNLISNAVKFKKADVPTTITFNYHLEHSEHADKLDEDWHIITISDTGIGFEQEYADKIFSPFQRLHSREEYKGTGIGLAVCRRIVERHFGVITASSEPGIGSVFTIKISASLINLHLDREQRNAI
ncbi:sensor histidine kinase [Paraglaciecola hydrolytica]|uniref:histidine kinase n=1 Tax=Paraglaciecola hydrolytica TaxID=1799789 RepID=A0A135ZYL2_9ALTE|nr:sensor histidine kinase [Paraglaciecola hydrolytica]KXI28072.1 histidine kinase [Paraglaciecola hydrolytica]